MKLFILPIFLLLQSCSSAPKQSDNSQVRFRLEVTHASAAKGYADIEIRVPGTVVSFKPPQHFADGQSFLKFLSKIEAVDSAGHLMPLTVSGDKVLVAALSEPYTLRYRYNVPQKIAEEMDASLPTLDENHGRFDGNLTFLTPIGAEDLPAELNVSTPSDWKMATAWGFERKVLVSKVSTLIMGQIVFGDYQFTTEHQDGIEFHFAIRGLAEGEKLKQYFLTVFKTQSQIMGPLPFTPFLVVLQPTAKEAAKGTSLTNSLVVNIPPKEKLDPFNFAVVGTISHELFHQWDLYLVPPKSEDGAYLLTEGFDNYFAVATLVQAGFVPEERFARFMWRYRGMLEGNPKYPKADFAAIQSGFKSGNENLVDLAYTKGPFVAILLDLALREDTNGKQSTVTWMREWSKRFAGTKGYSVEDLRKLTVELSGKANGRAVRVFDSAFLGNTRLDLDALFKKLGIDCSKDGDCKLKRLPPAQADVRKQIFSAGR